jgi:hypothetical protein
VDVALNLYLEAPPSTQLAELVATMDAWYIDGAGGGFGGVGFHGLDGPSVDGPIARWHVDLGSSDGERAIRALARRLGNLTDITVKRLVLGTETVG